MMGKQLTNICKYIMVFALAIALVGCDENRVFDQNTELTDRSWDYENTLSYEVEIADTNLRYNVYVNLRHTNQYTNSNLWVLLYTTFPSGEKLERRVELPLASKEGKWYGNHSGSIVNHQIQIQENAIFPEKGTYRFEIEQNMRRNPLGEILDVGLRVEKALK
ncbi:MAG: gliding motility lipoprotein GldH [Chitinophagales bacterium]